jgi:hypothetical protein
LPFLVLFLAAPAQAQLPPVAQLIDEARTACQKFQAETQQTPDWAYLELVRAQAYVGDSRTAILLTRPMEPMMQAIGLGFCARIELEQTGVITESLAEIRARAKATEDEVILSQFASDLIELGKTEEAAEFLPKNDTARGELFVIVRFHLDLAGQHAKAAAPEAAEASLRRAALFAARWPKKDISVHLRWLEATTKVWLLLRNVERARAAGGIARELLEGHGQATEPRMLPRIWLQIANLHLLAGDTLQARDALRQAVAAVEAVGLSASPPEEKDKDHNLENYARQLNMIATQQFAAGAPPEAAATYEKAFAISQQIGAGLQRNAYYIEIVELQCDVGDLETALKTVGLAEAPEWRALGYCRCGRRAATDGDRPRAQQLLAKAEAVARSSPELQRVTAMTKIGEAHAALGDKLTAKRLLDDARRMEQDANDSNWNPEIARAQIRAGLLEDAYQTIQAIEEPRWRAQPLAELAHQAAKRQAVSDKRKQKAPVVVRP